ncbi:MAG TPA: DNA repair protein RecO [Candidatus Peribacterales bacterium]|nr:DNA repair protein RecO [Candidatus Peribacterales bacterium]
MSRIRTTDALVLKAYDIGDADRFCVLLTKTDGRMTAIAKGSRKAQSKLAGALQSFRHLRVDLAEHSSGFYVRSAQCVESFDSIRSDLRCFSLANRGAELLLHFLHDTQPQESIFTLALDFFAECHSGATEILLPTFQVMLFKELGLLPSFVDASHSPAFYAYVTAPCSFKDRAAMQLDDTEKQTLFRVCDSLLCDHLSYPLKAPAALNAVF